MANKVLIISYYWPPSGGSGVQRWLKFTKYLPEFGYETHVYTPENPDFSVIDKGLEKEIPAAVKVVKQTIKEPYVYYRMLLGKKQTEGTNFGFTNSNKKSKLQQFAVWIRSNLFIPDARVWWVKPSINFLKNYISENQIDTVISTGPPQSMHLIGLGLKKHFGNKIQWITDFRDPWTRIYTNQELNISNFSKRKLERMEKEVLENCDKMITVSDFLKEEFEELGAKNKAFTIYNGFDHSDYELSEENLETSEYKGKFVLSYIGLFPALSNPILLWKVLNEICLENLQFKNDLKIVLVGNIDNSILQEIEKNDLTKNTDIKGIVAHDKAVYYQKISDLLLLCIPNVSNSKGILTGKLFEYLASEKPILAFGDVDGDVAKILKETNGGELFSYEKAQGIKENILKHYAAFLACEKPKSNQVYQKFSRKELTRELARIIEL